MDKTRTVVGVIEDVQKMLNTADGNPVWRLGMRSGATYRTKPDGTVGFEITPDHAGHHAVLTLEHVGGSEGWVVDDVQLGEKAAEPEPEVKVVSEHVFESWRDVARLEPGYYEVVDGKGNRSFAYSPDGVGCIWYDSRQDMFDGKAAE